uniref:Uncharacterized protein n=1 Tax=Arundo donax TaxID=35708 RepID=A0A0A9BBE8_ARUDO
MAGLDVISSCDISQASSLFCKRPYSASCLHGERMIYELNNNPQCMAKR